MKRRWWLLALAGGVACFVLGALSSRLFTPAPAPAAASTTPSPAAASTGHDGGKPPIPPGPAGVTPRILIDPDSIQLLPDASLHLELPPGFDAGPD